MSEDNGGSEEGSAPNSIIEADQEALAELAEAVADVAAAEARREAAVIAAYNRGVNFTRIARVLGTTRQSASQTYGPKVGLPRSRKRHERPTTDSG